MIEPTHAGRQPIRFESAAIGEERAFFADGDTVVLSGWCERPGYAQIGFGECRGTFLSALAAAF